jgi:hypothetical protein
MTLSRVQQEIEVEFVRFRGTWTSYCDTILGLDPVFIHFYLHLSAVPGRRNYLDPRTKEFV